MYCHICDKLDTVLDNSPLDPSSIFSFLLQVSNVENLSPQIIRQVTKEIGSLCRNPPEGIKLFMSDEDVTDIQAIIDGPGKKVLFIVIL